MTNPVQQSNQLGQSTWYDNIRRSLITSGRLQEWIDLGVTGLTANPSIFEAAISGSGDYDTAILPLARRGSDKMEIYENLVIEDIQLAADLLRPVYDRTNGVDGYASLEVNPHLSQDTAGTVAEAQRFFAALDRPNVMIKVPTTPEGIPAIRQLIGEGISVNVTLIFALEAYAQVREAYVSGLEALAAKDGDLSRVASVASFFVSRLDTAVDGLIEQQIQQGRKDLQDELGNAAVANARLAYREFQNTFGGERFAALQARGARVQRPLWASTGTKNANYSDVLYVDSLIGPDTVNTMPEATLAAFLDHGQSTEAVTQNVENAERTMQALAQAGISMPEVTGKLLADGVQAFSKSFDQLLDNIEEKKQRLLHDAQHHTQADLCEHLAAVERTATDLERKKVPQRIWQLDHTVWREDPEELADRLGWLTVTDHMRGQIPALHALAEEVRQAGYQHVMLLSMGGSSLGPEVLRQALGSAPGYPQLMVLDSTVPGWVQQVTDAIDPAKTLFLVSSKSGSTVEPNTFYTHFRGLVEAALGPDRAGQNFIAITDPGTVLEELAKEQGFRRYFSNPPEIGGRYSVLSYFGLVPAALIGVDLTRLLDPVDLMREHCGPDLPVRDNPGAWLGAIMGTLALQGRDKLTIVASPSFDSFGLWTEQLLAESTGKANSAKVGTGIIPVAGEPLLSSESGAYGSDRLFVYLRAEEEDNAATDARLAQLAAAGHPVVRLDIKDRYDLGAEFFRWEFATSVAGAVLDIQPFDQPNVQGAKDQTDAVLAQYQSSGSLPPMESIGTLPDLLRQLKAGDYLAIMAYLPESPELLAAVDSLRRRVMEKYSVATTFGFGPRFLHSTGQMHKGGPDSGVFLQLTADHAGDIAAPGKPFTFRVLADAQALGDLQTLQNLERRAARLHLGANPAAELGQLIQALG